MSGFDLLVLGDCNPDLIVRGDDLELAFDQVDRLVDEARLTIGGSSAILACGAARLGLRTAFIGVVGDDAFGRFMLDSLADRGVDVGACTVDPDLPTGLTVVLSRGEERSSLTASGTIASLRASLIDRDVLRDARHVHVASYYLQPDLHADLPALFEEAHASGATTSLDPGGDPTGGYGGGLREVIAEADVFTPNAAEATNIAGVDDAEEAARALAAIVPLVVVKRGGAGGLAVHGGSEGTVVTAPALPVAVVDTTGAGDSFGAGFFAGQLSGWSLEGSLALACACGSLSTRSPGGTEAQPTLAEALAAMAASR